jgi:hypothetical protein
MIWVTSDGGLLTLDCILTIASGPATITSAIGDPNHIIIVPGIWPPPGWPPDGAIPPIIDPDGKRAQICVVPFATIPSGVVGWFMLHCDGQGLVTVELTGGSRCGGSIDLNWEVPNIFGTLDIYVESPPVTYYVNAGDGNDLNNGLTPETAFATIQKGIDTGQNGDTVLVYPGVYTDEVDFLGKAITVQGVADNSVPIIEAPGDYAVSFYTDEGPNSILKNFVIRNSFVGVFLVDAFPTLRNLTIVDNDTGIAAYAGSAPDISNCILYNNAGDDLFQCAAQYSCVETGGAGLGNITGDPCFVDANNGDYHLKSEGWRWAAGGSGWTWDEVTSPCIDHGNPGTPLRNEPMSVPRDPDNIYGVNVRVNMGAYGGTSQASIPPHGWALLADLNNDRRLNWLDLAAQVEDWLQYDNEQPGDLNRDGLVNGEDFALLGGEWTDVGEGMGTVDFRYYWPFGTGNRWESEVMPDAGFGLEITDQFFVNGFEIWEFTNAYGTIGGGYTLTLYYVYVNGMLYATENLSDLDSLPEVSEGLRPQYPQIVQLGRPIYVPDLGDESLYLGHSGDVMAVRGTLSDVLRSTSFTVEDFPLGDQDDVIAFLGPYEYGLTVFARGLGPMRLYWHFIVEAVVP